MDVPFWWNFSFERKCNLHAYQTVLMPTPGSIIRAYADIWLQNISTDRSDLHRTAGFTVHVKYWVMRHCLRCCRELSRPENWSGCTDAYMDVPFWWNFSFERKCNLHAYQLQQCLLTRIIGSMSLNITNSGPSCSKLTTSLVNDSLKFKSSDTRIC